MEHELNDIEQLLQDVTRANLYNFLSRYPDYQDTISQCSSSLDSSALESDTEDYQEMTDILASITSTTTIVPCDLDSENNQLYGTGDGCSGTARNTLVISTCDSEDMNGAASNNRDTLTLQCDHHMLDLPDQVSAVSLEPPTSARSRSASPVFNNGEKFHQTVTSL